MIDVDKPGSAPYARWMFGLALVGWVVGYVLGGDGTAFAVGLVGLGIGGFVAAGSADAREANELAARSQRLREKLERDGGWS